jgi:hypothetical protein
MTFDLASAAGGLLLGGALASCALRPSAPSTSPVRTAFVMQLNEDKFLPEYKKRHDGSDEPAVRVSSHKSSSQPASQDSSQSVSHCL